MTVLILFGVIIYRYLAGTSAALWGIWKSPRSSTSTPIYYSSDITFDNF